MYRRCHGCDDVIAPPLTADDFYAHLAQLTSLPLRRDRRIAVELDVDVDKRTGHVRVAGLVDTRAEPIRNPVTGAEHRARIDLPHGFEYRVAEIASGSSKVSGDLAMQLTNSHSHLARLSLGQSGVVG